MTRRAIRRSEVGHCWRIGERESEKRPRVEYFGDVMRDNIVHTWMDDAFVTSNPDASVKNWH